MERFLDKVVIVTGAAGEIGGAVVRRLVGEGAVVLAVDHDDAALDKMIGNVAASGGQVEPHAADVTGNDDVAGYVRRALELWGRIDCFFNNAGIEGPVRPIVDYPVEDFDRVIAVNVRGVFLGLKHVLPAIRDGGAIVNTASALGLVGAAGVSAYVTSKHAVVGLTKSAALEAADRGVRVNAVCPGPIAGRMIDALEAEAFAGTNMTFANFVPLGRHGTATEVASLVAYLLSDEASYATGTAHSVDGAFITA